MKNVSVFLFSVFLFSCSTIKPLPPAMSGAVEQIRDCQYEAALDTLQQLSITANHDKKSFAFKYLGVIYREKGDLKNYNHTLERFLFSRAGRAFQKHEVISDWVIAEDEIKEARRYLFGKSECKMKF